MDGHRHDQVTDAALDREIESLLAVEPTPEFLARVRTRVAEEPAPGRWRTSWTFATAAAVAAVIVAVIVWPSHEPSPTSNVPLRNPRVAEAVEPVTPPASSPAPQQRRLTQQATARPVAIGAAPAHGIDIDLPEVVIADNEAKTFASLVAGLREVRFDATAPGTLDPDKPIEIQEMAVPSPVIVEPIDIEPIVKLAGALQSEGERP
jgi:hypothetical protein